MTIPLFHVDAFADKPFAGNPATVCILDQPKDDAWMQTVAAEMNLSETAFIQATDKGFNLGWLTPKVEVDLCGHATLASAHVLWSERVASSINAAGEKHGNAKRVQRVRNARQRCGPGCRYH